MKCWICSDLHASQSARYFVDRTRLSIQARNVAVVRRASHGPGTGVERAGDPYAFQTDVAAQIGGPCCCGARGQETTGAPQKDGGVSTRNSADAPIERCHLSWPFRLLGLFQFFRPSGATRTEAREFSIRVAPPSRFSSPRWKHLRVQSSPSFPV